MTHLANTFKVSRKTIYAWKKQKKTNQKQDTVIKKLVHKERRILPRVGSKKLYYLIKPYLDENSIIMGRDKLHKTLKRLCLLVPKKKMFFRTTDSNHLYNKHSNLVKGMKINKAEQLWVCDITYLICSNGTLYLSLITDAYSKKIVGYNVSDNLKAASSKKALTRAIKSRKYPNRKLIHHSDRGIQYCCPEYTDVLDKIKNKIKISMTTKYDPYENSIAERINGILKQEFSISDKRLNKEEIHKMVKKTINVYNSYRPHLSCEMMTPNEAHLKGKFIYKKWGKFSITEKWN